MRGVYCVDAKVCNSSSHAQQCQHLARTQPGASVAAPNLRNTTLHDSTANNTRTHRSQRGTPNRCAHCSNTLLAAMPTSTTSCTDEMRKFAPVKSTAHAHISTLLGTGGLALRLTPFVQQIFVHLDLASALVESGIVH